MCAQIQKESYGFGSFVATKIAEIQNKTDSSEWWWIPSDKNPADMLTKPASPMHIDAESIWQMGPLFLRLPIEEWPVSQSPCDVDLPDKIGVHLINADVHVRQDPSIENIIMIDRFGEYQKLLRVTARVLSSLMAKTLLTMRNMPTADQLKNAEIYWIKAVQRGIFEDWRTRYKRLGPSLNSDDVIIVGQRMAKWLKDNWNQDSFILLPAEHALTKLYVRHVHNMDHGGVETTLAKIQTKFWIPGVRRLIKLVRNTCVTCRKVNKQLQGQVMGQIVEERAQPTPAFYHTSVDLFGPFLIRDTVKRRTKSTAYGVIFTCSATRAVYLDVVEGYSTNDFLVTFRRFVVIHGYPKTMHSDGGPQFVAARKELRDMAAKMDLSEIQKIGAAHGMQWTFNRSADAPWENALCESLIRLVKRALTVAVGDSIFTFSELQTIVFEATNLLNGRPIGIKPGDDPNLGTYLCPNYLLLGRSGIDVPQGNWLLLRQKGRQLK